MNDVDADDLRGRTEKVLGLIGDDDAEVPPPLGAPLDPRAATNQLPPVPQRVAGEPTAAIARPGIAADESPESTPETIEPPKFWNADARERFKALPAELQRYVLQQEEQAAKLRSRHISDAAERAKSVERAEAAALEKGREANQTKLRLAGQLDHIARLAPALDPVLAQARQVDWAKLAATNPAQFTQFRAQVAGRVQQLQQLLHGRDQLIAQHRSEHTAREHKALLAKVPEWSDATKARQGLHDALSTARSRYGFSAAETRNVGDHRLVLMARDLHTLAEENARLKGEAEAARKGAGAKRVSAPLRVVAPNKAANEANDPSMQVKALRQQALRTGKQSDRMAHVLAVLGEG